MPQAAVIDMLEFYIKTARARAVVHTNSAIFYNQLNRIFSLPAIIITGIAGPLELMMAPSPSTLLNPLILIITCVLLSIQGVYKFAVKGEQHETASRDLYSLALHIETELALRTVDRSRLLKEVNKRFNEIVKQSPTIKDLAVQNALCGVILNVNPHDTAVNIDVLGSPNGLDESNVAVEMLRRQNSAPVNKSATNIDGLPRRNSAPILVAFARKRQGEETVLKPLACNEPFNHDTDKGGDMEVALGRPAM